MRAPCTPAPCALVPSLFGALLSHLQACTHARPHMSGNSDNQAATSSPSPSPACLVTSASTCFFACCDFPNDRMIFTGDATSFHRLPLPINFVLRLVGNAHPPAACLSPAAPANCQPSLVSYAMPDRCVGCQQGRASSAVDQRTTSTGTVAPASTLAVWLPSIETPG